MANKESILDQARARGLAKSSAGMSVPDGYFSDFAARMVQKLPYRAEAENPERVLAQEQSSLWTRVRPYVYMAAMFAGIWLMLQMFAMMAHRQIVPPFDDNPIVAEALNNDDFMFEYFYEDLSSYELVDEFMSDSTVIYDSPEFSLDLIEGEDVETPADVIMPDSML